MAARNAMLENLGITAIWFEKDRFDLIERLLELTRDELNHRRSLEPDLRGVKSVEEPEPENRQLDVFLRDFADLMPLLYWLHQTVPQSETRKYLSVMQKVFHAHSFFTEDTDENLIYGLDLLLRALSNNPHFDGYAHGKLAGAFHSFQRYLAKLGEESHSSDKYHWNDRELLNIAATQFESLLSNRTRLTKPDYHAIRLILALLRHGKRQLQSPQEFCELPPAVNIELDDYLALALATKLNLATPDRLDDMLTGDINGLCQNAWDDFEKPMATGLLDKIKQLLLRGLVRQGPLTTTHYRKPAS